MNVVKTFCCLMLCSCLSLPAIAADRVLFIRGANGSGGFLEGGSDDQLADIENFNTANGNHGWAELASLLRGEGYVLEQVKEGSFDLAALDLTRYQVIVFGSNNASYGAAAINKVEAYVRNGGGVLFISDANFGGNWGAAPSSDQAFLDRFGLIMNQDTGVYALERSLGDYVQSGHPILMDVNKFDGEGVSPISINTNVNPAGVTRSVLARAKDQVRMPNGANLGVARAASSNDGALVVALADSGRVAGHFDRNTFFNRNGAGTNLNRFDNRTYARNLFAWLAKRSVSERLDRAGWTATVSNSPAAAALALDGDVFTRWATNQVQTPGQSFVLDMQQSKRFDRIVLEAGPDQNDYPRGFEIAVSIDGVNWKSVAAAAGGNAVTDVSFARETARYIRIRQTGSASTNWWSIAEINVFAGNVAGCAVSPGS